MVVGAPDFIPGALRKPRKPRPRPSSCAGNPSLRRKYCWSPVPPAARRRFWLCSKVCPPRWRHRHRPEWGDQRHLGHAPGRRPGRAVQPRFAVAPNRQPAQQARRGK